MPSRDNSSKIRRIAFGACFAGAGLLLSYLESFLPTGLLLGIPGVRLGLANLSVLLAAVFLGRTAALAVSVVRVALAALLFGTPVSFCYSMSGAILCLAVMLALLPALGKWISLIGISVLMAGAHSVGQILCASLFFSDSAVFGYLPLLLCCSAVCGIIIGILARLLTRALSASVTPRYRNV